MTTLTPRQVAQYAYDAGFREPALTTAVAIAFAETDGITSRHNAKPPDNSYGLWQINMIGDLGPERRKIWHLGSNKDLLKPAVNAKAAFWLWRHDKTWGDWPTYGDDKYDRYHDAAHSAARWVTAREKQRKKNHGWASTAGRNGHPTAAGTKIVLDLTELSRVSALFGEAARRVTDTRTALRTLATELEPARAKLADPALAGQIGKALSTLESPAQLMALGKLLDHQGDDAAQTRRRGELSQQPSANGAPTAIASTRKPPPPNIAGLVNGKVPASKLSSVGDGEKLLTVAAKQFRKMDAAAKAAGIDLTVRSGYRTYAEQAYLYRLYKEGKGNLAAPPGKSTHGVGLSADIVINGDPRVLPWLRKHAATFGFANDVPSEPWHWTYKPK